MCVRPWRLILLVAFVLVAIVLGVGEDIGLKGDGSSGDDSSPPPRSIASGNTRTDSTNGSFWSPTTFTSWQIELAHPLTNSTFNATTISALHSQGRKVTYRFSAGNYENWCPDAASFINKTGLGKPLDGWTGEWWLSTNSTNARKIMLSRLDLASTTGRDGVDPDNMDEYDNDNSLDLTQADAVDDVDFLANVAHARDLSIGLKNVGDIMPQVIGKMKWTVDGQCVRYGECNGWQSFVKVGKPV